MSSLDHYLSRFNRDLSFGFHHFEPIASDSISRFFNHEVSLYSRRFEASEIKGVLTLTLELPGFKPADLDVQLEKGLLTVKAKNARDEIEQSINVGRDVDPDLLEATLVDGILTLKLPKLASAQPRKVNVK